MTKAYPAVPAISLERSTDPAGVRRIRRELRAFAATHGASAAQVDAIGLAVTEAVTNAVRHAYPTGTGPLRIEADVEDGDLEIAIRDRGTGFTTAPSAGAGLGLALIASLCSAFEIRDQRLGGVEVWMRFSLDEPTEQVANGGRP
jgi:anti-sigma regulatory factor (Ser/Thr protein kinase)